MTKDWFEIYHNWNDQTKELEILAVGEISGQAYKFNKSIKEADIKNVQ